MYNFIYISISVSTSTAMPLSIAKSIHLPPHRYPQRSGAGVRHQNLIQENKEARLVQSHKPYEISNLKAASSSSQGPVDCLIKFILIWKAIISAAKKRDDDFIFPM